ncbi:hypothetical protein PsorP6_010236 [Peronosclerospora sorghi]|uniref:Uncharacterized protein n=1 Tax=Peronosclerospora sorghi TaxID=230839 RepID=A0ACC0VWF0_9STRA|nr:hypothetical protein PsorP6_010236 [Peronosclerospora sorghi]
MRGLCHVLDRMRAYITLHTAAVLCAGSRRLLLRSAKMVKLFCAFVGVKGSAFSVKIDLEESSEGEALGDDHVRCRRTGALSSPDDERRVVGRRRSSG